MKILIYFADMLRADLVESGLKARSRDSLSQLIGSLGGTIHSAAYSKTPDTPRTLSRLLFGEKPGVGNFRHGWPGVCDSVVGEATLFDLAHDSGFKVTLYLEGVDLRSERLFPAGSLNLDAIDIFDATSPGEPQIVASDEVLFVQDNSYHNEVSRLKGLRLSHKSGSRKVANNLRDTLRSFPEGYFDHIFVFSDHGCSFFGENTNEQWLTSRSRIFLFHHRRDAEGLNFDSALYEVQDFASGLQRLFRDKIFNMESRTELFVEDYPPNLFQLDTRHLSEWLYVRESMETIRFSRTFDASGNHLLPQLTRGEGIFEHSSPPESLRLFAEDYLKVLTLKTFGTSFR